MSNITVQVLAVVTLDATTRNVIAAEVQTAGGAECFDHAAGEWVELDDDDHQAAAVRADHFLSYAIKQALPA